MKLWGFSACALGPIDVDLGYAEGDRLKHHVAQCSCCDYLCPQMNLADCEHIFCDRCVIKLPADRDSPNAFCILCRRTATITDVHTSELFVAKLPCSCPCCGIVLSVDELRDHFTICAIMNVTSSSRFTNWTRSPVESDRTPHEPHQCNDQQAPKQPAADRGKEAGTSAPSAPVAILGVGGSSMKIIKQANRLADSVEDRSRNTNSGAFPMPPACYVLQFYPCTRGDATQIYRTVSVYLGGVGFYFAAYKKTTNVRLWFAYLDKSQQQTVKMLAWRVTLWNGKEIRGEGSSSTVRNPQVGQYVHFSSVFDNFEREMAIITVRIEHLDS